MRHRFKAGDRVKTCFTGSRVCVVLRSYFVGTCERLDLQIPFADGTSGVYERSNVLHTWVHKIRNSE